MDGVEKKDRDAARAAKILTELALEHGQETFVTDAYAYYQDAAERFSDALTEARAEGRREGLMDVATLFKDCNDPESAEFVLRALVMPEPGGSPPMTRAPSLEAEIQKEATEVANEAATPVIRSMYPSRSRGQMANEFRHFFISGAHFVRDKLEAQIEAADRLADACEGHGIDNGLGRWMSAALSDEAACAEFKADIRAWFARLAEYRRVRGEK